MKFHRTLGLQIATFLLCFIMIILEVSLTAKVLPEKHSTFTIMVVIGFILWVAGFAVCFTESTIGFGLCALSTFIIMVGCSLPDASSGSFSELLIIYIPILLVPTSLIAVRGGASFKRVMLITIGILYTIVSIYMIAISIQSLNSYNSSYHFIDTTSTVAAINGKEKEILNLSCAYSFFSLFYYAAMIVCGFVLFRNSEGIED